jgi:hypothetical protein
MLSLSKVLAMLGLYLLLSALTAQAQVVGSMEVVSGHVSVWPVGTGPRAARKGDAVSAGDLLETRHGELVIRFNDGARMLLGPSSRMRIDVYRDGDASASSATVFSLMTGFLRSVSGLIGKTRPASFQLHTPTATIGVRGTDFIAQEGEGLSLGVVSGVVEVKNDRETSRLSAGQQVDVPSRAELHQLSPTFTATMRDLLNKSSSLDSSKPVSFGKSGESRGAGGSGGSGNSAGSGRSGK